MKVTHFHPWDVTPEEAIEIQVGLQARLKLGELEEPVRTVAGTDVSVSKNTDDIWAGVAVLSYPGLILLEKRWVRGKAVFPYIPGLLSFRELPTLLVALQSLRVQPDVILCDGQGIAHPRGMGLASHLGILLDKPAIGCAKSRLVGEYGEVGRDKGSCSELRYRGKRVGMAVRTRKDVKSVFISPGNLISLEKSVEIVLGCCLRYRLPEPAREAHLLVNRLRREQEGL